MNSFFCEDNIESLQDLLVYYCNNILIARGVGKNAYNYYNKYCTIENMYRGFEDAIEGTNSAVIDNDIN